MGYWPAHPDDPQGIRVASVFEFSECLFSVGPLSPTIHRGLEWPQFLNSLCACLIVPCVSANFLIFLSFILLFLYSTVQKSAVQYSYWPATIPGHVTTGKKVASVFEPLACLIVLWLCVSKLASSLEYPQRIRVVSVFETCVLDCLFVGKYYHLSPHPPLSPLLRNSKKLAVGPRPEYPQTTVDKVASAFELDFV